MAASTPEGRIKKKVTALLREHNVWYFFPGNNGLGKSGLPDIVAIHDGQFIGVEVKADKTKKPTALQAKTGREIMDAGGVWLVVFDDETIRQLEGLIK